MKTLLVLRHAKSSWDDPSLDDHARRLSARGRRDAPRVGDLLRELDLIPDLIISSDAVRAHTTALAVAEAAEYTGDIVVTPSLYHADPADIVDVLNSLAPATARILMIVGHNPGLEDLLEQLTGEQQDLPTAALAQLTLPIKSWTELTSSTAATLIDLWRPKERR